LENVVVGKLPKNIVITPIFQLADFSVLKAKTEVFQAYVGDALDARLRRSALSLLFS